MTRLYATFDPLAVGPALELERSNTVLTYTGAADIHRTARGQDGKSAGVWYAEFLVWGDADLDDLVSIGVVRASASLSTYVGGDANGYGYRLGAGKIHNAGASIQSVATGAKGQIVGLLLDATNTTLYIELDGAPIATITLPDPGPWHFAASLGGATGYDLRIMANTGQRALEFFRRVRSGWFALRESLGMFRISDRPFLTASTDEDPHVRFRGRLLEGSKLSMRRSLHFWPWGSRGSSVQSARGTLSIGNADRAYDALISRGMRDAQVRILDVPEGGTYADAVVVGDLVVDRARADGDDEVDITLADPIAQLAQALQRRLVRPDADAGSADTVYPISLGACRSIQPPLLAENPDEDEPEWGALFALHDGMVGGLGYIREGGYPLSYVADPPDYMLDELGRLKITRKPRYVLTADVSSVGGDLPGGPVDMLAGDGDFMSPANWTLTNATISAGALELTNTVQGFEPITAYARHNTFTLEAGKSYRITVEISFISVGLPVYGQFPAVILTGSPNGIAPWPLRSRAFWMQVAPGRYTTIISAPYDSALFFALVGTQSGFDLARLTAAVIYEINLAPVDDEALQPIQLAPLLEELIERRAGWQSHQWSRTDAEAIDAGGYAGIGLHASSATTIDTALREALQAWCACAWRDRAGVLRVSRLVAPETRDAIGTITRRQMLGALKPYPDDAPSLTTQFRGRKNWYPLTDDYVTTDTLDVPVSLLMRLRAEYRHSASYSGQLARHYAFAAYAEPFGLLLDKQADLQAEAERVGAIYSVERWFYPFSVPFDHGYELDQVFDLIYTDAEGAAIYELGAPGKRVVIVDIDEDPIARTATITMWG